jgi:hypothetical protein
MDTIYNFFASLASGLLKIFTKLGFMLLAIKGMILSAFLVLLTSVLYNMFLRITGETFTWASTYLAAEYGTMPTLAYDFAGLAGWLFLHLRIAECLALLTSAVAINFVLKLVRIKK